jgi:hypothetical protein
MDTRPTIPEKDDAACMIEVAVTLASVIKSFTVI